MNDTCALLNSSSCDISLEAADALLESMSWNYNIDTYPYDDHNISNDMIYDEKNIVTEKDISIPLGRIYRTK